MDSLNLASGDNSHSPRSVDETFANDNLDDENKLTANINESMATRNDIMKHEKITPETIDENELKLKERIAQCRNIIESLKLELNAEKNKLQKQGKTYQHAPTSPVPSVASGYRDISLMADMEDVATATSVYGACIDSKLNYDENLIEYEKQLQKYQNTLNMAQLEKKNAIRKQMLTKAYKLKLLEVENQCNIELLRVKQSLQCLEPLQMIVNKWKTNTDETTYDYNNFDLIPRYPELSANYGNDINTFKDDGNVNLSVEQTVTNVIDEMSFNF